MIVETMTFRLGPGAAEDAVLRADHAVQVELYSPWPGFLRRTTARGADGEWICVTLWGAAADAEAFDAAAERHPAWQSFASFLDGATVDRRRYVALD